MRNGRGQPGCTVSLCSLSGPRHGRVRVSASAASPRLTRAWLPRQGDQPGQRSGTGFTSHPHVLLPCRGSMSAEGSPSEQWLLSSPFPTHLREAEAPPGTRYPTGPRSRDEELRGHWEAQRTGAGP